MDNSQNELFKGGCICGTIEFKIQLTEAEKQSQMLCHCNYCKRMTGGCFTRSIFASLANLTITSGEPKKFVQLKDAPRGTFFFCENCGSQLYAIHDIAPERAIVRVGALDREAEFTDLAMQVNCENESPLLRVATQKTEGRYPGFPPTSSMKDESNDDTRPHQEAK